MKSSNSFSSNSSNHKHSQQAHDYKILLSTLNSYLKYSQYSLMDEVIQISHHALIFSHFELTYAGESVFTLIRV